MGSETRAAILAKVRQAQIHANIPATEPGLPERLAYASLEPAVLLEKLRAEFNTLGVENFVEDSVEGVRERVKTWITGKSILSWDADKLPYGLGGCLEGEKTLFERDAKNDQGEAEIGLTGCEAALAETGSLVMVSGPGRPKTASLLPFVHVAVIRRADILLGMGEYLAKAPDGEQLPYTVFITGPSRTADIELILTLGVHGPGKVVAVIGP